MFNSDLKLKELRISRQEWGAEVGKLTGEITFVSMHTKSTLILSEDRANQMLGLISDQLLDNARELGTIMASQVRALPAPPPVVEEILPGDPA